MNATEANLLLTAHRIISNCEQDLKRLISRGETRDLLKDNTDWDSQICDIVANKYNDDRNNHLTWIE